MRKSIRALTRYRRVFLAGILFGGLGYMLSCCLFLNSCIIGSSMEPTLSEGEQTIGVRVAFAGTVGRGDIISFHPTIDDDGRLYVKRIIGLPGETVEIRDGTVYADGEKVEEPYIAKWTSRMDGYRFKVPDGHYLVLGDNRDNSYDSRSWADPYVPEENIVAKTWLVYRPDSGFSIIH